MKYRLYKYGKVCLRDHDLLKNLTDLFKTGIFGKLTIRH